MGVSLEEGLGMRLGMVALICLIMVSMAYAMDMKERIHVRDGGNIYVQTDTGDSQDIASGIGEQDYSRSFNIGEDSSSLNSKYTYTNISQRGSKIYSNYSNYYYISGQSAAESQHSVSISSNQSIVSNSVIKRNGDSFSTNYDIKSPNGNLTEELTEKNGAKTKYIAQSKV